MGLEPRGLAGRGEGEAGTGEGSRSQRYQKEFRLGPEGSEELKEGLKQKIRPVTYLFILSKIFLAAA